MNASAASKWDERPSASKTLPADNGTMFQQLFEHSADAIFLFDPRREVFVDCNQAAVEMMRAKSKEQLLMVHPAELSTELQPEGQSSREKTPQVINLALSKGSHRFEWHARRMDGTEFPLEVLLTTIQNGEHPLMATVCRDITERKRTEQRAQELTASLEQRVAQRTAALGTSEARFRALVEHAPEAIVVFDGVSGRFLFGNEHACRLYGVPMEKLTALTPADVSPEFQPGGRRSSELARELMNEALAGGTPVFEWIHEQPDGRLIPTEVRLLRLPAEGQNLIRASIIDNTERKREQQALRDSEEKFRALFEGSIQGIILQDENQFLEVNPAAVRIMGRQSSDELVGKHPRDTSPPFQPNGESSAVLADKYLRECMANGSARFEWVCRTPQGKEIPLDVTLTRIQWSGRQVIQALLSDISERKQAEHASREANRKLRNEIDQRIRAEESLNERVRTSTLSTEVALALNAGTELQAMLQQCAELAVHHLDAAFARIWTLNETTQTLELRASAGCYTHLDGPHSRMSVGQYKIGLIAQEKKPHLTNSVQTDSRISDRDWAMREGMVAFAGYPLLLEDRVLGVLALFARRPLAEGVLKALGSVADSVALGIERKRAQVALAESEARFSVAFQASPIFFGIARMSDGQFVLINDAFVNWSGYSRGEILGHNTTEIIAWERLEDREAYWAELRRTGSIRSRECRFRNRAGRQSMMLLSSEVIQLNRVPHMLTLALDITERKKAEAELQASEARLRESEERFSVAFHASPALIGILRVSDGKYVLANDSHLNWLGYPREEVLGRTCLELGMWEDSSERESLLNDVQALGSVRQRECRWRNRAGERFTVLLSAETITLNDTPHILSMALDITQRKRAEEELRAGEARLRESEARFSAAFHASPIITGITRSSDGRFVLVNNASLQWSGYSRAEVLGRTAVELGFWENPDERDRFWEEVRRAGSVQERECRMKNRHGSLSTMLASGAVIEINGEEHLLVMMVDISQRKQAEEELRHSEARLRESEARFSVAFQASPIFINIVRISDQRYVWANDAFVNRLGYPREEVLGRSSAEFGMWENPAERDAAWNDMRAAGSIRQREVRWLTRSGEPFTILLSAEIIKFNDAPHILSLALDITQRKRAEVELIKTLEREKELSQLKSNFVSMVSHEFRTPLGIIQSSAELLRDFYQKMPPVERNEQLESITRNTRRMASMMEEILVLSRLDSGRLDFQPTVLDLNVYCRRIVDEVLSATNRRCRVELTLTSVPPEAKADEQLLGHIFNNLLSNAVKYSEPGASVSFTVERDGADAVCIIRDQGIGIAAEDQEQLFNAFHRGVNVGTRPGTGLGLLVVKRCVDLHRGNVQLISNLGEGTTVIVRLPIFGERL